MVAEVLQLVEFFCCAYSRSPGSYGFSVTTTVLALDKCGLGPALFKFFTEEKTLEEKSLLFFDDERSCS